MSGLGLAVESFALSSRKITEFLLAPNHVDNKGRAHFFAGFGFPSERPEVLARALLRHPRTAHAFEGQAGRIGQIRLVYDGLIATPDGRGAHVRTVWNFDAAPVARFITVFPLRRLR